MNIFHKKDVIDSRKIFEDYPVSRAVTALGVPTVISSLSTTIYNLMDTFWIGQINNASMVAGVSMGMSAMLLLNCVGSISSTGGCSLISRCLGAQKADRAKQASAFCNYMSLVWGIMMMLFVLMFLEPFALLLGASDTSLEYTKQYLFWAMGIGAVPQIMSLTMGSQIRSEGHTKNEMFGMAMGHVMNIVLDPILIFGCRLYVAGAAMATTLSSFFSVFYFLCFIRKTRRSTIVTFSRRYFVPEKSLIYDIFIVGVPASIEHFLASMVHIILNKLLAGYGDVYVAAMGIVQKLYQFPQQSSAGFCSGTVPLIGYNFAAKNYERMEKARKHAMKLTLLMSLCFLAAYAVFRKPLIGIFIKDSDVIRIGAQFLLIYVACVPLMTMNFAIRGTFQAIGMGPKALFISLCRRGIILIPLMYVMDRTAGVYGIVGAQVISDMISLGLAVFLYRRSRKKFMST